MYDGQYDYEYSERNSRGDENEEYPCYYKDDEEDFYSETNGLSSRELDEYYYYLEMTEGYSGYDGWDRNTIRDAFDGDPMNTWNVD